MNYPKCRNWCCKIFHPRKPYSELFIEGVDDILYACWLIKYHSSRFVSAYCYVQFAHPLDLYEVADIFDSVWQPPDGYELNTSEFNTYGGDFIAGPYAIGVGSNDVPLLREPLDNGLNWLIIASNEGRRLDSILHKLHRQHREDGLAEFLSYRLSGIIDLHSKNHQSHNLYARHSGNVDVAVFVEEMKHNHALNVIADK